MTTHELANKQNRYVNAPGKYTAKVKSPGNGWIGTTTKGTDFIRLPLLIDDPASDQHGREIVWQGWLTEKATRRTVQTLDAAFGKNWTIAALESGISSFAGQLCKITVEEEDYNGETRYKIKWLNPIAGDEPLSQERVKKLDSRITDARENKNDETEF
jgi:hypothetical protein